MSKRNKEIGRAQQLTQQQIDLSRQQNAEYMQMLRDEMGRRESYLSNIFGTLSPAISRYLEEARGLGETEIPEFGDIGPVEGLKTLEGGLTPESLAAMRANVLEQAPQRGLAQREGLRAMLSRRGGGIGPSGDISRLFAPIMAGEEQARAGGLRDIALTDEQLRRENILSNRSAEWAKQLANVDVAGGNRAARMQRIHMMLANRGQALGYGLGALGAGTSLAGAIGGIYSPNPYIGGASSSLGQAGQATGQRANLLQTGFWDRYGGALLGAGLNVLVPGAGGLMSGGGGGSLPLSAGTQAINPMLQTNPTFGLPPVYPPGGGG
jgi:hypothetical protein